jgi:hypothetical protein
MLEIYRKEDGVWIPFYPVDVNTNEVYESNLEGLPDCVMGKFMGGMVGYTPDNAIHNVAGFFLKRHLQILWVTFLYYLFSNIVSADVSMSKYMSSIWRHKFSSYLSFSACNSGFTEFSIKSTNT